MANIARSDVAAPTLSGLGCKFYFSMPITVLQVSTPPHQEVNTEFIQSRGLGLEVLQISYLPLTSHQVV